MSGAVPTLPLHYFLANVGTNLPLYLYSGWSFLMDSYCVLCEVGIVHIRVCVCVCVCVCVYIYIHAGPSGRAV